MAVDMYLKIGDIEGESTDSKKEKWIDVLAWSWNMSQSGTTHVGGGGGSGRVSVQDVSVTKYVDASTHALMLACCDGTHFPDASLIVRKAGKEALEYIKLTMKEVIITSLSTGGSGGEDRLTENLTINFAEFKLEYTPQNPDGTGGTTKEAAWNIAGNIAA